MLLATTPIAGAAGLLGRVQPVGAEEPPEVTATDICATEPAKAAQRLVDAKFTPRYDYALQTLAKLPYAKWREYDPEDTIRFYALRLHEAGVIKSNPKKIIAAGTDWRFLDEVKRELKT